MYTVVTDAPKEQPLYWPTTVASKNQQIDIFLLSHFTYHLLCISDLDNCLYSNPVLGADGPGLVEELLRELPLLLLHRPDELRSHRRDGAQGCAEGRGGDVSEREVRLHGEHQ